MKKSTLNLLKDCPKESIPKNIIPMMGTLTEKPFNNADWIFEIKWDGYRAIAEWNDNQVYLYSRNQLPFNDRFPKIVDALKKVVLKKKISSLLLDGEIVLVDEKGKSHFQDMQNYHRSQKGELFYYVFDIIFLNGCFLGHLPLIERKAILKEVLGRQKTRIIYSDHVEDCGIDFFKLAQKESLEGIMAKKKNSPYQMYRSKDWLKIKIHCRQEFVIGGFTQPKGSRKWFGSLLVGVYKEGKLYYVGSVGGGFTDKSLADLYNTLIKMKRNESPFENLKDKRSQRSMSWVEPKLVCEVSFSEWTDEGLLRQPIFKGLRVDKSPEMVVRE